MMSERKHVRYWEWGTFGALLGVICVALTLLPMPRGGHSQVVPERLFFLPIVPPSREMEVTRPEEPESSEAEPELSAEEMAAMLAEAFGAQETTPNPPTPMDLSSQSAEALTVEGLDLSAWDTAGRASRLAVTQERGLNLRGRASRRLAPTLIQPEVAGSGAGNLRIQIESRRENPARQLETHASARRAPVTMDDFSAVVAEDSLARWIQAHPSVLDPGIHSLFGAGPEVVTARHAAQIDAKSYALYLMLAPFNGEVRIALVDGAALYYFVSPKGRRQASYFQRGTVRRDANGRIVTVESEDLSPHGAQAQAFYGLFVDWWRTQGK